MSEITPGADQIAKHRAVVEKLLGESPYVVMGARAGQNGEIELTLKLKDQKAPGT
jgi:hypothetical protein